jgi:hypothetical protein
MVMDEITEEPGALVERVAALDIFATKDRGWRETRHGEQPDSSRTRK